MHRAGQRQVAEDIVSQHPVLVGAGLQRAVVVEARRLLKVGLGHGHVGAFGNPCPRSCALAPPLHLEARVKVVLPTQVHRVVLHHRVLEGHLERLRLVGEGLHALDVGRLEVHAHHRVVFHGLHNVVVLASFLHLAVHQPQGHVFGQVAPPLAQQHGKAEGGLLVVVQGQQRAHGARLVLDVGHFQPAHAVHQAHHHHGQRVFLGILGLHLVLCQRLQGQGQRVEVQLVALTPLAEHVVAHAVQVFPRHVVLGGPAQHHAVGVAADEHVDRGQARAVYPLGQRVAHLPAYLFHEAQRGRGGLAVGHVERVVHEAVGGHAARGGAAGSCLATVAGAAGRWSGRGQCPGRDGHQPEHHCDDMSGCLHKSFL